VARYQYQNTARSGMGTVIPLAVVNVYAAGSTTVVNVYAASTGGAHITSVTADAYGIFTFFVDEADYYQSQKFKVVITKTNFATQTIDNITVFPGFPVTIVSSTPADAVGSNGDVQIYESGANHYILWKAGGKWYKSQGTAVT
jgi:hypothetical protein